MYFPIFNLPEIFTLPLSPCYIRCSKQFKQGFERVCIPRPSPAVSGAPCERCTQLGKSPCEDIPLKYRLIVDLYLIFNNIIYFLNLLLSFSSYLFNLDIGDGKDCILLNKLELDRLLENKYIYKIIEYILNYLNKIR